MIKEDKLSIDSFKTSEGKNYRQAQEMDKGEITGFFEEMGFEVLEVEQLWRHIHGKLKKDDQILFFKMASTKDIGERTKNEVSWNNQIGEAAKQQAIDTFAVPKVFQTGEFNGNYFYISEFYEGPFLATKEPRDVSRLEKWLDKIVDTNLFFLRLENIEFDRDKEQKSIFDQWDEYFNKISSWHQEVKENDLDDIFEAVKEMKNTYKPAVNHGDFVPWHMIEANGKFVLIDAEHASSKSPRYYDIVYFYHRLYTSANSPDLAKKYLNMIRERLPADEKEKFERSIRPIIAARIIGGFWDAKTDGQDDLTYHQQLRQDFLDNNL